MAANVSQDASFPLPPVAPLSAWWAQMVACSIVVAICFCIGWWKTLDNVRLAYAMKHAWSRQYCMWMRLLAIPYTFECIWRSWLPSQYNARITLVDSMANSILVERMLAAVGECCWAMQFSWALRVIARNVPLVPGYDRGAFFVRRGVPIMTHLSFILVVVANAFSITATVTTNYYYNVWEESLWAVVFYLCWIGASAIWALGTDDACLICARIAEEDAQAIVHGRRVPNESHEHHYDDASIWVLRLFVRGLALFCFGASIYQSVVDVPYWHESWLTDQANNKTYFTASNGFADAAYTRHPNQTVDAWKAQFFWMSAYFFFGPLSSILLMWAPGRVRWEACDCPVHDNGLVTV